MLARRLRAPSQDGGLLADPPLVEAPERLNLNIAAFRAWRHDFQGRPAERLRAEARREILSRARDWLRGLGVPESAAGNAADRLIVTGHQPELFHPGVWVKNFAAAGLARQNRAVGLNLIVDDDIPKGASIRVPHGSSGLLRTTSVEFDEWRGEVPYEEWSIHDEGRFASFPARVLKQLGGKVPDPILDRFWPLAIAAAGKTGRPGERFAAARRALEGSWGIANLEVPLSAVCETDGFLWFASHLLAHLPRFQAIHNRALERYRALYGIRSTHHPVPSLSTQGEWREAPFWVWRAGAPRRRPLLARSLRDTVELRIAGEDRPFMTLPLAPEKEACCAVEALRALPAERIRLRTRALTTTMFARLILGDLFIHGIGGAKYDELGDAIINEFFGVAPPAFLTVSMTLWLGLADSPASIDRLRQAELDLRELSFNADRHLPQGGPDGTRWIQAKQRALALPVATRKERIARHYEILRCNRALEPLVAEQRPALEAERDKLLEGLRINRIARGRDYAFVLHSTRRFLEAAANAVPGAIVEK
jgi:hypothetical protein